MTPPSCPRLAAAVAALALLTACNVRHEPPSDGDESADEQRQSKQTLGESTEAYAFDGTAGASIPTYQERVAMHVVNRMRMDTRKYEVKSQSGIVPPQPPMVYDPDVSEAGRWQAHHGLSKGCACPQNPMAQPAAFNTCCTMTRRGGKVYCKSQKTSCDSDRATQEERRWELLNDGSAGIFAERYILQKVPVSEDPPEQLPGSGLAEAIKSPFIASPSANAFGIAQVSMRTKPDPPMGVDETCADVANPCDVGRCTDPESGARTCPPDADDCSGVCMGSRCDGVCRSEPSEGGGDGEPVECTRPEPPAPLQDSNDTNGCRPINYPRGYYVSFLQASTGAPRPTLMDGIHLRTENNVNLAVHYYEPAGEADRAEVVLDGECSDLSVQKRNVGETGGGAQPDAGSSDTGGDGTTADTSPADTGGDATTSDTSSSDTGDKSTSDTSDASTSDTSDVVMFSSHDAGDAGDGDSGPGYRGLRYGMNVDLEPGCHRYVFSVTDAEGIDHTYPSYGSLGARVGESGNVLPNDESCPVWSSERPDTSCLPEGDECSSGDTRQCYTGRTNSRGRGVCEMGTESCENGRWSGVCEGEVTPASTEKCGDGKDNDCNGYVDEGCGQDDPSPGPSDDAGTADAGADAGSGGDDAGPTGTGDSGNDGGGGCGCSSSGTPPTLPMAAIVLLGAAALLRRR